MNKVFVLLYVMKTDFQGPFKFHSARLSPKAQIPLHAHDDCWEIACVRKGSGVRTLGDVSAPFSAGDAVISPPRAPHCWRFDAADVAEDGKIADMTCFVRPAWLQTAMNAAAEVKSALAPLVDSPAPVVAHGQARQRIGRLMELAQREPPAFQAVRLIEILLLFAQDANRERIPCARPLSPEEKALADVRTYMTCNSMRPVTLADAAREFGKSRSAFCSWIKSVTGKTFVECLTETRLADACDRLASTPERITDVAAAVGYADIAYFNRQFKRRFGVSPTVWRRNAGAGGA